MREGAESEPESDESPKTWTNRAYEPMNYAGRGLTPLIS